MVPTSEQEMLRDAAAGWVRERAPIAALRSLRGRADGAAFDPALFAEMAEMGWAGVVVPEADGGFGLGFAGMGLLAEELGRNLVASPLVGSAVVVASALVLGGSDEQKARWLPGLVSGEIHAALAVDEGLRHDPAGTALAALADGAGWRLDGVKRPVFDASGAALLLVAARTSGQPGEADGISLFLCPGEASGLGLAALNHIDSRAAAVATFSGVVLPGEAMLGAPGAGFGLLDAALDRGRAVLAAEMLGSAQQAFDTTVEYLRTRVQFDQPIGSFQALQHRAADLLGELELARSAVRGALAAADSASEEAAQLASLAKALAGKVFRHAAREMIQMHGGIGMTDEHDAGLYLKRAQVADLTLGDVAFHRERYARLAGI